jgi:hypothetical protein
MRWLKITVLTSQADANDQTLGLDLCYFTLLYVFALMYWQQHIKAIYRISYLQFLTHSTMNSKTSKLIGLPSVTSVEILIAKSFW